MREDKCVCESECVCVCVCVRESELLELVRSHL